MFGSVEVHPPKTAPVTREQPDDFVDHTVDTVLARTTLLRATGRVTR